MGISHITLLVATICLVTAADSLKRVPSGFTGVRGKKSIDDREYVMMHDIDHKRAPTGFLDMHGKELFTGWLDEKSGGPSSGFLGMRGKKNSDDDAVDFYKRAPNGFLGMRGKKEFDPFAEEYSKRAPSGFLGMRGKKDIEMTDTDLKRAPVAGFLGMRGNKQPARSGFFGMRGKKYPYEFRGKFVGVRGKKSSDQAALLHKAGGDLDFNQLMLLLTENEPYNNNPTNFIDEVGASDV